MAKVESFRDLIVWQKSMDLSVAVHRLTRMFPKSELYGLTSQLQRAAVSVPANISEGQARSTARDYAHFLHNARGSLSETETHLLLAVRLDYLADADVQPVIDLIREISRMLVARRNRIAPRSATVGSKL